MHEEHTSGFLLAPIVRFGILNTGVIAEGLASPAFRFLDLRFDGEIDIRINAFANTSASVVGLG